MEYWHNGSIWGGIFVSGYDPGTTKYWHNGMMYGDTLPSTPLGTIFVPIIMFFS
mgnify:CR=1 FL=1